METAVAAGYRHFDTAAQYENETELGRALRASNLKRDDYFLTTKIWYTEATKDAFRKATEESLERLDVGPVDLLLFHWPLTEMPLEETVAALCAARKDGLARHIRVSNFPIRLLERAIALADAPITVNQCECHPYFPQDGLRAFCKEKGVAFMAHSPIGSGKLGEDPVLQALARTHARQKRGAGDPALASATGQHRHSAFQQREPLGCKLGLTQRPPPTG